MLFCLRATQATLLALHTTVVSAAVEQSQAIITTDFASAVDVNVCSEYDGKHGPGPVSYMTSSCECLTINSFRATCHRTRPVETAAYYHRELIRDCDPRNPAVLCSPTTESNSWDFTDCACIRPVKKVGSKPPRDPDGVACSGGIHFEFFRPDRYVLFTLYSTITTSERQGVRGCYVQNSSTRQQVATSYPCDSGQFGSTLQIDTRNTYQACIDADDNSPSRINFEWQLTSAFGRLKRGGYGRSAQHMHDHVHYEHSLATPTWHGEVVLHDQNGEEISRFGKPAG